MELFIENLYIKYITTMVRYIFPLFIFLQFSKCQNNPKKNNNTNKYDSVITVQVNQKFSIPLLTSSNYSWKWKDSNFICYMTYEGQNFKSLKNLPGGNGLQTFFFRPTKKGHVLIEFMFVQPYIKPYPQDAKKKYFEVIIK